LVVPFNKALFFGRGGFVVANSGYFTVSKGQRYDRLKRKRIFQISWKEKITWIEASGRLINPAI
jgi:hypothetical protein